MDDWHHYDEEISMLHNGFHWVLDSPAVFIFLLGIIITWSVWWMRHMFVSLKSMEEFKLENRTDHEEIKGLLRGKADK